MTKNEFEQINRQIAIMWAYSECNQIDTFAIIGSLDVADKADLGMTRKDFDEGVYWSRSYVNRGKDVVKRTFPMIGLELFHEGMRCCNAKYQVMFFDKKNCADCGGCSKNIAQVKADIIANAKTYINMLNQYTKRDGGWTYDGAGMKVADIDSHIQIDIKDISPILYDSSKGIYYAYIDIEIEDFDCDPALAKFEATSFPDEVGIIRCKDCEGYGADCG